MKANTKYDKKIANRFHNTEYYECNEYDIKNHKFLDKERQKKKTEKKTRVSEILIESRTYREENVFNTLQRIYIKNRRIAFNEKDNNDKQVNYEENSNLLNLVASVPLLMVSYAKIRKNPGSMTLAYPKGNEEYEKLDAEQKNLINKIDKGSDGIDNLMFEETSKLLKKGKYPWGTSKRVYIDKPGKPGSKRPITIPPFMDRVVQESIRNVLAAIYEPYFDKMNVSFGFRPNIGVHDAIYTLTNQLAQGLDKAIEGDIKSAYDKVNRKKLVEILGKKIKDRKFLKLIENRLNYDYYDTELDKYVKEETGIPQGGTDSPYLWNIYMLEFDVFIMNEIKEYMESINTKTRGPNSEKKKIINNERQGYTNQKLTIQKILNWIRTKKDKDGNFKDDILRLEKMKLTDWKNISPIFDGKLKNAKTILKLCDLKNNNEQEIIEILQKKQKETIHRMNKLPFLNQNKKRLRLIYARYADDWIILTNLKLEVILIIKEKIKVFLLNTLYAELSDDKTKVTDIKLEPARFLGFEIRTYKGKKIARIMSVSKNNKRKMITAKVAGSKVFAGVDKQRLIDKLHMKGYCTKEGFPREITKLNNLEAFTIIDRTNSVLSGLVRYYANSIRNPKSELSRWIYVIRFSCLKTLALKHRTTLRKIFDKFKSEKKKETHTIEDTVIIQVNEDKYQKTWRLGTIQSLMENCRSKSEQIRKREMIDRFWKLHNGTAIGYEDKKKPTINSDDFINRINWVNLRTKANFNLPCALCGSEENVEMHHIKHVRKTKYNDIKKENTWQQIMGLRNRRQMPVCRFCHMHIIHRGNYRGKSLNTFTIEKLYDNRMVNSESYVHKAGAYDNSYKKSLIEKGWVYIK